ncbi:MAG TPA: glucuronate isomerase [Bacteroidetes bacterium]|nr:glucuronate isomerase [Bacteroidota bacterium]
MENFINDNFLLQNKTAEQLYHDHAKDLPIIDYHNHLSPQEIAEDKQFDNLTQIWLNGDHYKWRAMRANGIDENYITGNANDWQKFEKWAETVPYTMRNPLYHWTHLELKRYFGISKLLSPDTAKEIYDECSEKLQTPEYSARNLLRKMKVESLCTTDDPTDDLLFHKKIKEDGFEIKVLPTFRPDKILTAEQPLVFKKYIGELERVFQKKINSLSDLLMVLKTRLEYFSEMGCRLSDHGLNHIPAVGFDFNVVNREFTPWWTQGKKWNIKSMQQFNAMVMNQLAKWYHEKDWVQQFHLGALRNNSSRLKKRIGEDAGCDSIGDFEQAGLLSVFLNRLDKKNNLAKTILYNLNPRDNEVFATMVGNFQSGDMPGKMQWGSAWWFLDQKDGMEKQINTLSNMGLLSRFIGMLTDSRSFLSFPRHEYFRRILCNIVGEDVEKGLLPNDIKWLGEIVQGICYFNAKKYFDF